MRVATFSHPALPRAGLTYGLVTSAGLHPVAREFAARWPDLTSILAGGALGELAAAVAQPALDPAAARFAPVIPDPGRILCVGVNYLAHIREMGREVPAHPTLFVRYPDSLVGHDQPLLRPRVSREYDYEGELALVIGRRARYLREAEALQCLAGYTCFLDGSVRDWQRHTSQFLPGKNFPATGSAGPWLVTTDEIPDPAVLRLETRISGELMQAAPISDLCFNVPRILSYCSTFCELRPGDIIATGTPAGVGFARQPPRWLVPGDVVEVTISGIGTLRNQVIAEA